MQLKTTTSILLVAAMMSLQAAQAAPAPIIQDTNVVTTASTDQPADPTTQLASIQNVKPMPWDTSANAEWEHDHDHDNENAKWGGWPWGCNWGWPWGCNWGKWWCW
ncbi:MAG: hypothetical protein J3R72DRAFT_496262 [Linnemannia gamsii]|nr:hypothetical protein BGX24_008739 [Mortierella sp. AD032]KAK3829689.1 MAG: hypothetical protein J3R72DRAFT_496262 [Linnemannia gamsii]